MSSLESEAFSSPRSCVVIGILRFDTGKEVLRCRLDPGVDGFSLGLSGVIDEVLLTARHKFDWSTKPPRFPVFVYICDYSDSFQKAGKELVKEDLAILAIGELYRSMDDAKNHRFD